MMNLRNLISPENLLQSVVGLRPYRKGSARMEIESAAGKLWAHNYGHGGSGITLCWGASRLMTEKLCQELPESTSIAVLGAGVMGLCSAYLLLKSGHKVTVYAQDFPPHTTSDIAGGLWAPTHIAVDEPHQEEYRKILEWSWRAFEELESKDYGVQRIPLFEAQNCTHPLEPMPAWLVGEGRQVDRLPVSAEAPPGTVWNTFLIETGTFLSKLSEEIRERGGRFEKRSFSRRQELYSLCEKAVVNCLGLGAGKVFQDKAVMPIRGQLLYLKPASSCFVLDHEAGYIISRRDRLILGGTFEENISDLTPCSKTTTEILEGARRFPWG